LLGEELGGGKGALTVWKFADLGAVGAMMKEGEFDQARGATIDGNDLLVTFQRQLERYWATALIGPFEIH